MNRTIKWICCLIILSLALGLAACAGQDTTATTGQTSGTTTKGTTSATTTAAPEPVKISVMMVATAEALSAENNEVTQWLEENTNVTLDIIEVTGENATDKRNLLINSGDYPEMFITAWWMPIPNDEVYKYGVQSKVFIPLNDMISEWGVNTRKVFDRYPGIEQDMTQPDGNIYGLTFPQRPFHGMEKAGKLFINTTWLKNLGLDMPATTDEFTQTMIAFRDNDPNQNGEKDEVPMSGCQTWNGFPEMMLLNSFAYYTPDNPLYYENDTFDMQVYQPGFRDGVAYVASLVEQGLIDKASWTQNGDQLKAQVDIDVPLVGAFNMGHLYIPMAFGSPRGRDYDIVAPTLKGPSGYTGVPWNDTVRVTGAVVVLTDKCENPEAAFKWIDFCASDEASMNLQWGMKGIYWDDVQPGDKTILDEDAEFHMIKYRTGTEEDAPYWWGGAGIFQNDMNTRFSSDADIYAAEGGERRIALTSVAYAPFAVRKSPTLVFPPDIGQQRALIHTNINNYINQNLVEFFTGKKDVDKDWDAFLGGLEGLQVQEYIDLTTQGYETFMAGRGQ